MKLEKVLDVLAYTHQYEVDISSLNSFLLYLENSEDYITTGRVADEFNISDGVSSEILGKLKRIGILERTEIDTHFSETDF